MLKIMVQIKILQLIFDIAKKYLKYDCRLCIKLINCKKIKIYGKADVAKITPMVVCIHYLNFKSQSYVLIHLLG